jgi:hypothetical protein
MIKASLLQPIEGSAAKSLCKRYSNLDEDDRQGIFDSAAIILKNCPALNHSFNKTGLVLGFVQSGKTASFTAVSSLARDNGFAIVILVTGNSIILRDQSTDRLADDLDIDSADSPWAYIVEPTSEHLDVMQGVLQDWFNPLIKPFSRKTVFISLLKHHGHLQVLINLFASLEPRYRELPTLIIDDEADQAGLNNQAFINSKDGGSRESTTYKRIGQLRSMFSRLLYLQYTATPQAVLLINLLDRLSPDFHFVLEPGREYIGGKFFFDQKNKDLFIKDIPTSDIPSAPGDRDGIPESLLYAIQIYLIEIAIEVKKCIDSGSQFNRNISMLIHPSRLTDMHRQYELWVDSVLNKWKLFFKKSTGEARELFMVEFEAAYLDLSKTVIDLPEWKDLKDYLEIAANKITIKLENATEGKTPEIDWKINPYPIIIGGQAVDRGFTVRGLTVTYLTRNASSSNEDSHQQRGRFFGYKHDLLPFCRLFIDDDNYVKFKRYIESEETLRTYLKEHSDTRSLRRFFLSSISPTRTSVLDGSLGRVKLSGWVIPFFPLPEEHILKANKKITSDFLSSLNFTSVDKKLSGGTPKTMHEVATSIHTGDAINFLRNFVYEAPKDSIALLSFCVWLERLIKQDPEIAIDIYWMSRNAERSRSIGDDWCWNQSSAETALFSGESDKSDRYIGDKNVKSTGSRVSIQFHNITLKTPSDGIFKEVPILAIWIPKSLANKVVFAEKA